MIGPALVLSVIVGLFHVSAYVFIRGQVGARVPLLVVAAFLGAWAVDALGGRLNVDPLRIGDYHVILASLGAWLGIAVVAIVAVLAPEPREREARPPGLTTSTAATSKPEASKPAAPASPPASAPSGPAPRP